MTELNTARHRSWVRPAARVALVVVAMTAVLALALVVTGRGGTFRFGSSRLTLNDFSKPLTIALGALVWTLIQEWRHVFLRRIAIALLALSGLLAVAGFARQAPPIVTDSDFAVTELYTELAARGRLLVGPYSRFGWNHPGPMYFYLQAAPYAASGHRAASLYAMALAINFCALATIVWVVASATRGPLLPFITLGCVAFAWRAPWFLASPWTAHVPVLASLAFVFLCAAVIAGRARLLPLAMVFGSFITQTHVGFVPMTAVLSIIAVAAVVLNKEVRGQSLWIMNASAWIWFALWLLPLSEALSAGGGNLAALWRFFAGASGSAHSFSEALGYWSYGLAGILRPDFRLPWGGHFTLQHLSWVVPYALAQALLSMLITLRDFRRDRHFEAALGLSISVTSLVGLWAITRIQGDVVDHEIFWLVALGALNLAFIGAAGLDRLAGARLNTGYVRRTVAAASAVTLIVAVQLGLTHLRDLTSSERTRRERARIPATYQSIRDYVAKETIRTPLIDIEGDAWSEGAGVLLRFLHDGTPVAVTDNWTPMFTRAFESNGDEDAVVTIAASQAHHQEMVSAPGHVIVRDAGPPYVSAVRLTEDGH